eukprot:scaffold92576_cov57-Phaeocystis_antarctica.AAC.1
MAPVSVSCVRVRVRVRVRGWRPSASGLTAPYCVSEMSSVGRLYSSIDAPEIINCGIRVRVRVRARARVWVRVRVRVRRPRS